MLRGAFLCFQRPGYREGLHCWAVVLVLLSEAINQLMELTLTPVGAGAADPEAGIQEPVARDSRSQ